MLTLDFQTAWLAPWILQIQDCSLFSEQFLYIEMITNAEYEKPTKIKCGHIMLYYGDVISQILQGEQSSFFTK